jgi:hypothetical protein
MQPGVLAMNSLNESLTFSWSPYQIELFGTQKIV